MDDTIYDLREFEWLGRLSNAVYVGAGPGNTDLLSPEDFVAAGTSVTGVPGVASGAGMATLVTAATMGFELNVIPHPGTQETILGATRGDLDFIISPFNTTMRDAILDGDLTGLWIYSHERDPEIPDVPSVAELGYESLVNDATLHRLLAVPPGTPADIVEMLRETLNFKHVWKMNGKKDTVGYS